MHTFASPLFYFSQKFVVKSFHWAHKSEQKTRLSMQPSVIIVFHFFVHMLSFLTDIALYCSRRSEAYKNYPKILRVGKIQIRYLLVRDDSDGISWITFVTPFSFRQTNKLFWVPVNGFCLSKFSPLSLTQIGFVCASQYAHKVITLSIFGRHHCHSPFSPYSPTRSLKQDSEACGGGYIGHYLALWI